MNDFSLREFCFQDAARINALALEAFQQYEGAYQDWPLFQSKIANMAALAQTGEIVLAELDGRILGAVAYVGPGATKADFFKPHWPIMRMLVVAPGARGRGIGRALARACLQRAERDGATEFALHTSKIMDVALPMYERMGFQWVSRTPDIHGVEYGVYVKKIQKPAGI
ncbi:GNAT family N-acetyltransferase [Azohydromonas lata]|uniref:GNAT family N-acetyltransferase n=1 Tax=Azohydromonas lata TaxID=45677 RepID=UPI00082CFF53|nr:GNAT family N-acetyltransferase [Azohydromonas lata]